MAFARVVNFAAKVFEYSWRIRGFMVFAILDPIEKLTDVALKPETIGTNGDQQPKRHVSEYPADGRSRSEDGQ